MNVLALVLFAFIVAVLFAVIIKVNLREGSDALKAVANIVAGICLVAAVTFLPFRNQAPCSLYSRALAAVDPEKTDDEPEVTTAAEDTAEPVTEATTVAEITPELPDFVVYECDDYYISMDREEHVMEIVPSEERLDDVKATDRLAYYCYSTELTLAGHPLKVYAARLAEDEGFVCVVFFDEYYKGETNPGFTECDALFRLHDEENGYMYGFAYVNSSVESARGYYFYIGSNTTYFDGMYDALKLDKKYFE